MRKLCLFALGFVPAILAAVLRQPGPVWTGLLVLAAAGAAFALRGKPARRAAIVLLGAGVGIVWCAAYQALFLRPLEELGAEPVSVEAEVLEAPRATRYGGSVLCNAAVAGRSVRTLLYFQEQEKLPEPGDRICCEAALTRAAEKSGGADAYYFAKGILLTGRVRGSWTLQAGPAALRRWPARLAARLSEAADRVFPEDTAGFLKGLLFGERSGMDYAQRNALSVAGIYHAVAVSGMHVSILFGVILLLCGGNRLLAALLGLPVVACFVAMTGAAASSVRAGCMLALLMLAPLVRRENDPPTSLCAALIVLLAANPWAIADVGLQLSFASAAGILLFSGRLYRALPDLPPRVRRPAFLRGAERLLRAMRSALACSLASMVFSLPLTAVHFRMVSLAALAVNPLCLWAVSILFSGGLLLCLLGLVWPWLAGGLGWVLAWLVRYVLGVVRAAAGLPFAAVYLDSAVWILFAAALYGTVLLLAICPESMRKRNAVLALTAAFAVCLGCAALEYRLPEFTFTMLDVGQGQCLIFRKDGRTTVIDCGGLPDESGETAARYLQSRGVYTVDDLVLTHYDADHVNGAAQLLRRERVRTLWLPDTQNELRPELERAAAERGCTVEFVREDREIADGLTLFAPVSSKNDNDSGICCLASAGEYDILITGDLSKQAEYRLLAQQELPDIELLVAGHHGAKTSTSETLLERTRPETVLISAGADNRYGHPAAETLDTLARYGAEVFRTDRQGTITIWR